MTYLYEYLAMGVVVACWLYIGNRLKQSAGSEINAKLQSASREKHELNYKIIKTFIGLILVFSLVAAVWPVMILLKIQDDRWSKKRIQEKEEWEKEFEVTRSDLIREITVQDVEQSEMVFDPLGAVPNIPFGHLNVAWKSFLEKMNSDDTLWSFSSNWTNGWGDKEIRAGYVVLKDDAIGKPFYTIWRKSDED